MLKSYIKLGSFLLKSQELNEISKVIFNYQYNDYRNYNIFRKDELAKIFFYRMHNLFAINSQIVIVKDNQSVVGLACLSDSPWETKYFGIKISKINYLMSIANKDKVIDIKRMLLSSVLNIAKKEGIKCIMLKIDTQDFSSVYSLEDAGFKLMATHLTYIVNFKNLKVPEFKGYCRIRRLKKKDISSLLRLTKLYAPRPSRFELDPYLPPKKSNQFYIQWVKNACDGSFADNFLVAERDGKIVGFFSYKVNNELKESFGINSIHKGLLIVSPQGKGSALSLLKEATLQKIHGLPIDLAELEVYSYNYPIIRLYQKLGMVLVQSKYVFHTHLN